MDLSKIPWKSLCGTVIVVTAMLLGQDGQLAAVALTALFGVEVYDIKTRKEA